MEAVAASRDDLELAVELNAPRAVDTYYYGACVDPVTDESNTRQQLLGGGDGDRQVASRCKKG